MKPLLVAVCGVVLCVGSVAAQKVTLSDQDQADAVRLGTKDKGKLTGLFLQDTGQQWAVALSGPNAAGGTGFSLRVYTPMSWVMQMASDAAKEYRPFAVSDIMPDMLDPVLRVVVYPDKPTRITARGISGTSSVEHVVLRDEHKRIVVQPISKEPFTDTASSALRDMSYQGIVARFPLDGVRELRGPKGDQEFLIVVVGGGTREREFKVKQKHFERLP